MVCKKCSAHNPDDNKFCGECGTALEAALAAIAVVGEEGVYYCARHKKEITRLLCGRCETPVCPRCAVYGPAGVRCRDCARNRVPIRARGVLHQVSRGVENSAQGAGRTIWYMVIFEFIISLFSGIFGGHRRL